MQKTPRNKMIGEDQERTKGGAETPKRKKKFFFPIQQRTVEAESQEAAEAIINKEKKN